MLFKIDQKGTVLFVACPLKAISLGLYNIITNLTIYQF